MARAEGPGHAKLREIRRRRRRAAVARALAAAALLTGLALALQPDWLPDWAARPADATGDWRSRLPAPLREWLGRWGATPEPEPEETGAAALAPPPAVPVATAASAAPPPSPAREPEPAPPPLAESDGWVRDLAAPLSSRLDLAAWLIGEDLIRRFAAAVDNVAAGRSPRKHVAALEPRARFRVAERDDGRIFVDPRSYQRYDRAADVVASLDPQACARLYARLRPLIDEAYRDLGHPDGDFDDTLARAFDELLATPVVQGDVELLPRVLSYEFRDTSLEDLSPAQKHLLRMGPRNVIRIRGALREIAAALRLERAGRSAA